MRVAFSADHAGAALKAELFRRLGAAELGHELIDLGGDGSDPQDDYPDFAAKLGFAIRDGDADRGILICGSGVGASVASNKMRGVRAAVCHDTYSAHQGVEHDYMNVLVIGGRVVGVELARELVSAFLNASFNGAGRHPRPLAKMTTVDNPVRALQLFGQSVWLDSLRRSLVSSGDLRRLIDDDGVRGVTTNPALFDKAISGSVDYADFLVLMTGRSNRHVDALAQAIEEACAKKKKRPLSTEGTGVGEWILIDFGDVVVHIFQEEARGLYDIEGLWLDAKRLPVPGQGT